MAFDIDTPGRSALPPLVTPPSPEELAAEEAAKDTRPLNSTLVAVAGITALALVLIAFGWGFTQWSSARDWKHRSQSVEKSLASLQARTTAAENARVQAQAATYATNQRLLASENRSAQLANQLAVTHDMRVLMCEAVPDLLNSTDHARICP
jgi:hypothetical protein